MPSIQMPTISIFPAAGKTGAGKAAPSVLPLTLGEMVEAIVGAKTGTSRFLLTIRNSTLSAYSDLPLSRGEKLTVRVEQLQPQVVLSIVRNADSSSSIISRYASWSRANPEALKDIFTLGREIFGEGVRLEALPERARSIMAGILNSIDSFMTTGASAKDTFSLKNYLTNLGLMLEFDLRKVIEGKKEIKDLNREVLKVLFQRLSEELKAGQSKENSAEDIHNILKILDFSEKAIRTLEGLQIINTQSEADEGRIFLQIPVVFPDDVRTADLFVRTEKDNMEAGGVKRYHVAIFLSLDTLGEMMADATLTGNKLLCVFKFENPAAREFVSGFTGELERNIMEIGFGDVLLNCVHSDSVEKTRREYHQEFFSGFDAVNVFA